MMMMMIIKIPKVADRSDSATLPSLTSDAFAYSMHINAHHMLF